MINIDGYKLWEGEAMTLGDVPDVIIVYRIGPGRASPDPRLRTRFRARAEGPVTGELNLPPAQLVPHLERTQGFTDIEIVSG